MTDPHLAPEAGEVAAARAADVSAAPTTPPKAVVVVHGVGDQTRSTIAFELAHALGLAVSELPATDAIVKVERGGDLVRHLPDGVKGVSSPAYRVTWKERDGGHSLPVYEFYWFKDTRGGNGPGTALFSVWQLLVGMPRLGLHALAPQQGWIRGPLRALTRFLYTLAWVFLLLRFVALLVVVLLSLTVGLSSHQQAEIRLPFDLLVSLSFVGFMASLVLLWVGNAFRTVGGFPAMVGFTYMAVVTVVLPEAILWKAAESKPAERESRATPAEPAPDPTKPLYTFTDEDGKPVNADWFYQPTTMPGFLRHVPYLIIIIFVTFSALRFAWLATRRRNPDRVAQRVRRLLMRSRAVWVAIAAFILTVPPGWDLWDFWWLCHHDLPREFFDRNDPLAKTLIQLYQLAWLPFAVVAVGLLSSRQLRAMAAPLLELGLDVLNYFPPIRRVSRDGKRRWSIDSWPWLRRTFGGWQDPGAPPARDVLAIRLRHLLQLVREYHRGPILVVAHSLGSVISLSALARPVAGKPCANAGEPPRDLEIDLVTLGSPLALLATIYPAEYASVPPAKPWDVPGVRSWHNLYRAADVVGRAIGYAVATQPPAPPVHDQNLGQGTHANYYGDERLAQALVRFLSPAR